MSEDEALARFAKAAAEADSREGSFHHAVEGATLIVYLAKARQEATPDQLRKLRLMVEANKAAEVKYSIQQMMNAVSTIMGWSVDGE